MHKQNKNRLSKILAACGVASRRASEELIFEGRVTVNGKIEKIPQTIVNMEDDAILVDGKQIGFTQEKVYYMLNKPKGYVCTNRRHLNTKLVIDLFPSQKRLFTVGRLDVDTEGLILVTNDGHFSNRVIHPSFEESKEYLAKVRQEISHEHLVAISHGTLVQGVFVKPLKVEKVRKGSLKIVVAEGKKHEVKLLLQAVNLDLLSLKRIRIGPLTLGTLPIGHYRALTLKEKEHFS